MPVQENMETFDEINNKLAQWFKENLKLKGADYNAIFSISKPNSKGEIESMVFLYSSLTGETSYAVVKTHVANVVDYAQRILRDYQFLPATEPLVKQQKGDSNE